MRRDFGFWAYVAIVVAGMIAFGTLGGTKALGAHPWWADQVAFVGIAMGLPAAWLVSRVLPNRSRRLAIVVTALAVSGLVTYFGKARFVASFAEDTLAGRGWYFGWMAVCVTLVVFALQFAPRPRR